MDQSPQALFLSFVASYGNQYPYNELRATRTNYHGRWALLGMVNDGNVMRMWEGTVVALHTSVFSRDILRHLIITFRALPVPPDMEPIIDCMYHWGRGVDRWWYHEVLHFLQYLLHARTKWPQQIVWKRCIEFRVRRILRLTWATESELDSIYHNWEIEFDLLYIRGNRNYYHLAFHSAWTVNRQLAALAASMTTTNNQGIN